MASRICALPFICLALGRKAYINALIFMYSKFRNYFGDRRGAGKFDRHSVFQLLISPLKTFDKSLQD